MFAKIKGYGFSFIHPDYVERQNGDKWDIIPVAIPVTGVSLSLDKVALNVGKNKSLTATVLPEDASNKSVVWTSSNTGVVTVDQTGKVTAVAEGSATITVTTVNKSKTATCSVTVKGIPAGALGGEFSVSATKKVLFSKGNLVATIIDSGAPTAWKFATNQYDYIGEDGANKTIGTSAGDIDLFGWSTASTTYGISTSTSSGDYSGDFVDWGKAYCEKNNITPDNTWRTLSSAEWTYLFNTRAASPVSGKENARYAKATVNSKAGIILLPDTYAHPEGVTALTSINTKNAAFASNTYDSANWTKMESAGAVFLPAAGFRNVSNVGNVGDRGYYWSSTALGSTYAYFVNFSSYDVDPDFNHDRYYGYSVRLITECQ